MSTSSPDAQPATSHPPMNQNAPRQRRPARLRPVNLVFGAAFCLIAAGWYADRQSLLTDDELGTLVAVALIVLGVAGLLATLALSRRSGRGSGRRAPAIDHSDGQDPSETMESGLAKEDHDGDEASGSQR